MNFFEIPFGNGVLVVCILRRRVELTNRMLSQAAAIRLNDILHSPKGNLNFSKKALPLRQK